MLIPWHQFKELRRIYDIRPESFFASSHIPGAISLPVDIDLRTLKLMNTPISRDVIISRINNWDVVTHVLLTKPLSECGIYCQHGGLRSEFISAALSGEVNVLSGGFEGYAQEFRKVFERPYHFIRLTGKTGSGKTDILHALRFSGIQVLDLESLSQHRGSVFGAMSREQPSQWEFEQLLSEELAQFDLNEPILVEHKPGALGSLNLPRTLDRTLQQADSIEISCPRDIRVQRLVSSYGKLPVPTLIDGIETLGNRLGKRRIKQAKDYILAGKLNACADLLLEYYDQGRGYRSESNKILTVNESDPGVAAREVMRQVGAVSR